MKGNEWKIVSSIYKKKKIDLINNMKTNRKMLQL